MWKCSLCSVGGVRDDKIRDRINAHEYSPSVCSGGDSIDEHGRLGL